MPSSVICSFRYDETAHELTVEFVSGRIYVYAGVPLRVAQAFAQARSKGRFFNDEIRDRFEAIQA